MPIEQHCRTRKQRSNFLGVEENTVPSDERNDQIEKLRGSLLQLQQDKNSVFFSSQQAVKPTIDTAPRDLLREKIENFKNIRSSFQKTKTDNTKREIESKAKPEPSSVVKEEARVNTDSKNLNDDELLQQSIKERKVKLEETLRARSAKARFVKISENDEGMNAELPEHVHYKKEQPDKVDRKQNKRYNTIPGDSVDDPKKVLDIQEFKGRISEKLYSLSRQSSKKKTNQVAGDDSSEITNKLTGRSDEINTESEIQPASMSNVATTISEHELKAKENSIKEVLAEEKAKLLKAVSHGSATQQGTSVANRYKPKSVSLSKSNASTDTKQRSFSSTGSESPIKTVQSEIMSAKNLRNLRMPVAVRPVRAVAKENTENMSKSAATPRNDGEITKDGLLKSSSEAENSKAKQLKDNDDSKAKDEAESNRLGGAAALLRKKKGRRCLPTIPLSADLEERKRRIAEHAQIKLRAYSSSRASLASVDDVSEASTLKNIDNIESEAESIPEQFNLETKNKKQQKNSFTKQHNSVADSVNAWQEKAMAEVKETSAYGDKQPSAVRDSSEMNDQTSASKGSGSFPRTPGDGQDSKGTILYKESFVKNLNTEFKKGPVHKKSTVSNPQTIKSTISRIEEKTQNVLLNSQSNERKTDLGAKSVVSSEKPHSSLNQMSLVSERRKARTRSTGSVSSSRPTSSKSSLSRSASVKTNTVVPRQTLVSRQSNVNMPQKTLGRHPSNNSLLSESETSGFADQDYSHSSRSSKVRNTQNLNRFADYSPEHSVKSFSGSNRVPQSAREPKSYTSFSNPAPLSARDPPSNAARKISKTGHSQEEILQAKQALLMYAAEPVTPRSSSRILAISPQKSASRSNGENTPHNQSMYQLRMTPDSEAATTPHNMTFSTPQIAKYPNKSGEKGQELDINRNVELQRIRPSLHDVVRTCDLFTVEVTKGNCSKFGMKLFESVFIDAGASPKRQSLRSPKGKRPMIGQNNSAFKRVRTSSESEVKSIISIDSIEENSAAQRNGHLQEGDHIIEIDDKFVLEAHVATAQAYIQRAGDVLKLVVARIKGGTSTSNSILEGSNLSEQSFDIREEKDMLKLKYQSLMLESQQKDKLIEELRSIIVKRAQVRQIKDGMKPYKLNIDDLEEECSAV
ncbi:uncharacterized protein LOC141915226 [Tubulanus polymorphus]|uniref:uncharacterized protein LOC141915226 n=1 Tax=Tubulanus polymorphus TaxID=672921 RepID=UPI003DA32196